MLITLIYFSFGITAKTSFELVKIREQIKRLQNIIKNIGLSLNKKELRHLFILILITFNI